MQHRNNAFTTGTSQARSRIPMLLLLLIVSMVSLSLFLYGCEGREKSGKEQTTKQEATIGVILPLTGVRADAGIYAKNGFELAVQEVNRNPKNRNRYTLKMVYEDDAYDPKLTVTAFQKLKDVDKVRYVIGGHGSSNVLAIAPLAEQARIILITASAQSTDISKAGDYIFRTQINTAQEGAFWAARLANWTRGGRLSILGINTDYLPSFVGSFVEPFEKAGGAMGIIEKVEKDQADFRTELLKATENGTGNLLLVTISKQAGLMLKQARELGINATFYGTSPIEGEEFIKTAGDTAEGFTYPYPYDDTSTDAKMKRFRETYLKTYGKRNEMLAANAYDTIMLLSRCFERVGTDVEKVKMCLYGTKNYSGASGTFSFDENGDVSKPFVVKMVKDREFVKSKE